MIRIIPVEGIPIINSEGELWDSLYLSLPKVIQEKDVLVCAHTPFSRIRGPIYRIRDVMPSDKAKEISRELKKEPEKIEVVLRSSVDIVKTGRNVIISENKAGVVCANAGVDQSNAGIGYVLAVPDDPDSIAQEVRSFVKQKLGKNIAVIISDTVGRALRKYAVNIAIGVAGLNPIRSEIGKKDLFGYELRVSEIAIADELAAAAELLQGQTNEGFPFIIVRGYNYIFEEDQSARVLNRPKEERLFK